MEKPSTPLMPSVGRADSQSSFWRSSVYLRERHLCRYILATLSVLVIIGMIIGIIFVAHYYYHIQGGQGFLRARQLVLAFDENETPQSCLPLRTLARPTNRMYELDYPRVKRRPSIMPFYICGDQQNSCEAFYQANICCPVGMSCYSTPYTNSGTFCCNSTAADSGCQASQARPPKCPPSSIECNMDVGGGCCSTGTACSENGCIMFDGSGTPPPITSTYITTIISTTGSKNLGPSLGSQQAETDSTPVETTIITTVTMIIGGATTPTATVSKQGEEAQKAEGASMTSISWPALQILSSPFGMLAFIAFGMMFA